MKCKIVFTYLLSATEQYISNFDLNISAQIRTRSSEDREQVEQEVLAFEAAHHHRIERECDDGCPTNNDSGLDAGASLQLTDSDERRLVIDEEDAEDEPEEAEQNK